MAAFTSALIKGQANVQRPASAISWREVKISGCHGSGRANETSSKVDFEMEQVGDRVDVTASILDASAQPATPGCEKMWNSDAK